MRIGIDLGGTKIEAIALDVQGIERARRRIATPQAEGYHAIIGAIGELVRAIEVEVGSATIGVGMPGAISPATGLLKNSNTVCLNGRPLDRDLSASLGREVRVANDADCFALSEASDGAGAGAAIVFGVIVGTGVGGGIVIERRLLHGASAIAGEWGHNPLPWPRDEERPGPDCYCGKKGCIETWLSGPGLSADHQRVTGESWPASKIATNEHGHATLDRWVDRFARSIATVINVLDPHAIVVGGGLSNIEALYREVPKRWGRYVFSDRVAAKLLRAQHGDSSGVRGAAWLWPA